MGRVYSAEQIFLKKLFALKTFTASGNSDVERLRFQREAQAANRLEHQNIARAIDFGSIDEDRLFMVMEFVEGPNLAQYLQSKGHLTIGSLQHLHPHCLRSRLCPQAVGCAQRLKAKQHRSVSASQRPGSFCSKDC